MIHLRLVFGFFFRRVKLSRQRTCLVNIRIYRPFYLPIGLYMYYDDMNKNQIHILLSIVFYLFVESF